MSEQFMDRIIRPKEECEVVGLSRQHITRLEKAGHCEPRFRLCPGSGQYGATGKMMSSVLANNEWRADGMPGAWREYWAAHKLNPLNRDN